MDEKINFYGNDNENYCERITNVLNIFNIEVNDLFKYLIDSYAEKDNHIDDIDIESVRRYLPNAKRGKINKNKTAKDYLKLVENYIAHTALRRKVNNETDDKKEILANKAYKRNEPFRKGTIIDTDKYIEFMAWICDDIFTTYGEKYLVDYAYNNVEDDKARKVLTPYWSARDITEKNDLGITISIDTIQYIHAHKNTDILRIYPIESTNKYNITAIKLFKELSLENQNKILRNIKLYEKIYDTIESEIVSYIPKREKEKFCDEWEDAINYICKNIDQVKERINQAVSSKTKLNPNVKMNPLIACEYGCKIGRIMSYVENNYDGEIGDVTQEEKGHFMLYLTKLSEEKTIFFELVMKVVDKVDYDSLELILMTFLFNVKGKLKD